MPPEEEQAMTLDTPWRRDLGEVGPAVEKWAKATLGPDARVSAASSPGNGMSSETVLFEMTVGGETERYAARLAPMPEVYPVFPEYDIELQAKCMKLVRARTDVPAPDVRWVELDPQWLGTPFLVMRRIDGEAPPDIPPYVFGGWVADATPETRAAMQRSTLEVLEEAARAHARQRRPRVPRPAAARRHRAAPAGRARALVLRLGARRTLVPVDRPDVRVARGALARRRRDGAQLGRRARRQHPLPRLRADRGARLGDGHGRAARGRPRVDDLPAHVLPRHGGDVRPAGDDRLHAARLGDRRVRGADRATPCRTSTGSRSTPRCGSRSSRSARASAASPTARWRSRPTPTTSSCSGACSRRCSPARTGRETAHLPCDHDCIGCGRRCEARVVERECRCESVAAHRGERVLRSLRSELLRRVRGRFGGEVDASGSAR